MVTKNLDNLAKYIQGLEDENKKLKNQLKKQSVLISKNADEKLKAKYDTLNKKFRQTYLTLECERRRHKKIVSDMNDKLHSFKISLIENVHDDKVLDLCNTFTSFNKGE